MSERSWSGATVGDGVDSAKIFHTLLVKSLFLSSTVSEKEGFNSY